MAGNVNLIDPNLANINSNQDFFKDLGAPPYEKMHISVDLKAVRRGRTVLETTIDSDITRINKDASGDKISFSFLGYNQTTNNVNSGKFTTNYYVNNNTNNVNIESFGISNINVLINSSYIPQIDIEFIDIKGQNFFNNQDSPYRILYDFPPPIFFLTIKGYYGKAITYQMHLVKNRTAFKSNTGNYHINSQFIAITYAPLTDILFKYILQAPLMQEIPPPTLNPDGSERPQNTIDLILKLQNLYSSIPKRLENNIDNERYENSQEKLADYGRFYEILVNYKQDIELEKLGTPQIFTYITSPDATNQGELEVINTFVKYEEYLQQFSSSNLPNSLPRKLYLGFFLEKVSSVSAENVERNVNFSNKLNDYKSRIVKEAQEISPEINLSDIGDADYIYDNQNSKIVDSNSFVRYIGIDLTNLYVKLYKTRIKLEREKESAMGNLNETINNMIQENLGMKPTIYNIFKIILDDVDTFFDILRGTAIESENHHEIYENQILNNGNYKDVSEKIYPFPLIVKQEKICNQVKEIKTSPLDISDRLDQPFPELKLVDKFIESFISYNKIVKQATLREEKTTNGDNVWIPFTPADSSLVVPNLHSPYYGTDSLGGNSESQPIDLSEDGKLSKIFKINLTRFYVLTQNTLPYTIYNIQSEKNVNDVTLYLNDAQAANTYISLYAKSEALNLVNSIFNEDYAEALKRFSFTNKRPDSLNDGYYTYLEKFVNDLYSFSNTLNSEFNLSNGLDLYLNRNNEKYNGLNFVNTSDIVERVGSENSNDDFEIFINENKSNFFNRILKGRGREETFSFTQENVIYRKDVLESIGLINQDNPLKTKFLANNFIINKKEQENLIDFYDPIGLVIGDNIVIDDFNNEYKKTTKNYNNTVNQLIDNGNKYFFNQGIDYVSDLSGNFSMIIDIVELWSNVLTYNADDIYDSIIKYDNNETDRKLRLLIFLSNFGYTLSMFNYYPFSLNRDYFVTPSLIEIPRFLQLYIGLLVDIKKGDTFYEKIFNFFVNGDGKNLPSGGVFIFSDIHDINTYLSRNDKDKFKLAYESFYRNESNEFLRNIDFLYNTAKNDIDKNECEDKLRTNRCIKNSWKNLLHPNEDGTYYKIIETIIQRIGLVCYNEITFRMTDKNLDKTNYISLQESNLDNSTINNKFFSEFFNELYRKIDEKKNEIIKQEEDFKKSIGDEDITTQTYYSFKNINDKWLSGLNKDQKGYSFKTNKNKGLISQFAFVDRAMNPIGDTIIDPKTLVDVRDDTDVSIFTVISRLLSLNGFEFFPLQNFLKFNENEWEDSFKIDNGSLSTQYPVFVCMYIGGSSSYPSTIENFGSFKNDGIIDLSNPGVSDFIDGGCEPNPVDDNQLETTSNSDIYSEIRAFRVRFGEQNQNMFTDFDIDSNENKETNESIQILSRLAGDNKENAPVAKGQNLYNIYENRSYMANITGLGNAMIQPTQYFQLENIPIFNGAYVILSVEHIVSPNKMITKFSGMKILKYPMPRVLNPAAIVGFEGGSTSETNSNEASLSEVLIGVGTGSNPNQTKYNSMYNLEIGT